VPVYRKSMKRRLSNAMQRGMALSLCLLGLTAVWGMGNRARRSHAEEQQTAATMRDGYKLVWADEFDTDGPPDPKNWIFEEGFVRNQEAQWYQPQNARIEKGILIIEGRRETRPNPRYKADSSDWKTNRPNIEYTAASLLTRGKHSWKFGRFEMRGRIDTRPGLWPAFWTLGNDGEWPSNGEIDIMEFYRGKLLANVAWGTKTRWNAKWDSTATPLEQLGGTDWAKQFHTWRMDWDEKSIKLYVDDRLLNETDLTKTINGNDGKTNPFHQSHYILLNLAIGGQNGGDPSKTEFPSRFEVDYVRVYQKIP
jgi:beta-glucanase (GH16 family)